jgi:hypothetical protein
VKWSESLSNRVYIMIRKYGDHMKFPASMTVSFRHILAYSFGSIVYRIYGCTFCMLLLIL